jgi:hypothetical protein
MFSFLDMLQYIWMTSCLWIANGELFSLVGHLLKVDTVLLNSQWIHTFFLAFQLFSNPSTLFIFKCSASIMPQQNHAGAYHMRK